VVWSVQTAHNEQRPHFQGDHLPRMVRPVSRTLTDSDWERARYTSRIAPWVHYVPIQVSYADLYDAVAFFRVQDALGRRIARAGRAWSRRYWRREDMAAYLYRYVGCFWMGGIIAGTDAGVGCCWSMHA